jgi:hypothetical protein
MVFVFSLPVYLTLLQTACTGTGCAAGQPGPDTASMLHGLGLSLESYVAFHLVLTLASMGLACTMSGLLVWRKSHDGMALLVALMLLMLGTANIIYLLSPSQGAWRSPVMLLNILTFATVFLVCFLIPTGRFVPAWTRWLAPIWIIWGLIVIAFPLVPSLIVLRDILWLSELACSLVALLYRHQRISNPRERQQTRWVVFGSCATIVILIVFKLPSLLFPALSRTGSLYDLVLAMIYTLVLLPVIFCFAIAILRYRLWDLDLIINRALVYGTLTLLLTLIYGGLVISLQALVRLFTERVSSSPVVIVASTLVIAALFQPLRHRLQRLIDRRFYRRKYDAAKTIAAFGATCQQQVDLATLSSHLMAVVSETMQPTQVSLWLRTTEHSHRFPSDASDREEHRVSSP